MHSHDTSKVAALFVPSASDDLKSLRWRVQLIGREKIYSAASLTAILDRSFKKKLSAEETRKITKYALSDDICIDEYERAILVATCLFLMAETIADSMVLFLDHRASKLIELLGESKRESTMADARRAMLFAGEEMLKKDVVKIRAKIAFQEVVTLIAPDELIPKLVEFSPVYLASNVVQSWIAHQQKCLLNDEAAVRKVARKRLDSLSKAILGDQRKNKRRQYPYWRLCIIYEELVSEIKTFRDSKHEDRFDRKKFELFCSLAKIPEHYAALVLDKKRPPKQLALEIMTERKQISDPKAFRDFQPFISKLERKHFGGKITDVFTEWAPILASVIDLPSFVRTMPSHYEWREVLEKIPVELRPIS